MCKIKQLVGLEYMQKPIKYILFTGASFPEGNASSIYLSTLCKGLRECKREVEVFLLYSSRDEKSGEVVAETDFGVKYNYLGQKYKASNFLAKVLLASRVILNAIKLVFSLRKEKSQIIVLVYHNIVLHNLPIFLLCKLLSIRLVAFVPEFYDKPSIKKEGMVKRLIWYGFIFNMYVVNSLANRLIVFSSYLKGFYIRLGYRSENIYLQPNLTDFDYWESEKNIEEKYTIGYSGSAYPKDGLGLLFDSIKVLKNNGTIVNSLIIGDAYYGKSMIPALVKYCKSIGIEEQVTFTGLVKHSEVKNYLSQCKILVLSRKYSVKTQAGFPTKLGEYFACNKTIITTNFGDISKYFRHKKDLVIVPDLDENQIADEVEWVLNHPEEAKDIQIQGNETAKLLLDYKINVNKIINYLEEK